MAVNQQVVGSILPGEPFLTILRIRAKLPKPKISKSETRSDGLRETGTAEQMPEFCLPVHLVCDSLAIALRRVVYCSF